MTERELVYAFEGRQLTVTLRPKESEADVLSIASDLGVRIANDADRLKSALEPKVRAAVESSDASELDAAVAHALPCFIVTTARPS